LHLPSKKTCSISWGKLRRIQQLFTTTVGISPISLWVSPVTPINRTLPIPSGIESSSGKHAQVKLGLSQYPAMKKGPLAEMFIRLIFSAAIPAAMLVTGAALPAQSQEQECSRPAPGSVISSPKERRSHDGVLQATLSLRTSLGPDGERRYCYVDEQGNQSPTLRLKPGDLLVLNLKNELAIPGLPDHQEMHVQSDCASVHMQPESTNLHFHGLMIPPVCHGDDVLNTTIAPGSDSFEYRIRIPTNQPPGLYWYHPHPHGHSEEQVLGGASGAIIVEGIEAFEDTVWGLPERLIIFRDLTRHGPISELNPKPPSKDLSVNFVPVPYPDYPEARVEVRQSQRELWRVLNASADTLMDLHLLANGHWQSMGLISLDGVPLAYRNQRPGKSASSVQWTQNVPLPPGGRAEFLFDAPTSGSVELLTSGIDTVPFVDEDDPNFAPGANGEAAPDDDDYTPPRWLMKVMVASDAPELGSRIPNPKVPQKTSSVSSLATIRPNRTRKLYFSEKILDPKHPQTSTEFYLTEAGHHPSIFKPGSAPDITVRQGSVEDWIIENRSQEVHTFHIHQTHFIVLARDAKPVHEPGLRDTVTLRYWEGGRVPYPTMKLRVDFRDSNIVGTFPYHCHILQHEDGGMMGTVRVVDSHSPKAETTPQSAAKQ